MAVTIPVTDAAAPTILVNSTDGEPVRPAEVPEVFWFSVGILSASIVPEVILSAARLGIWDAVNPVKSDPSPEKEVAVTTPTEIPVDELLPSDNTSSRVWEPPPPPLASAPTNVFVDAWYFRNLPSTNAVSLSISSRNSKRTSPPPPNEANCCWTLLTNNW